MLVGKFATGVAQFLTAAIITRLFLARPSQADAYFLTASAVVIMTPLASLGYPRMVVRFLAQQPERFRFLVAYCTKRVLLAVGVLLALLLLTRAVAPDLVGVFISDAVGVPLAIAALAGFASSLLWIEAVRAIGRVPVAATSLASIRVGFCVVVLAILLSGWRPDVNIVFAMFAAMPLLVGIGVVLFGASKSPRVNTDENAARPPTGFASASRITWTNSWLFMFTVEAGYLILNAFGEEGDVSLFAATLRLALLVQLPLTVLVGVAPPLVAKHYERDGDNTGLSDSLQIFSAAAAIPMLGAVAILAVGRGFILNLAFGGDRFAAAGTAVLVVCGAQAINALFGPSQSVLMMTGREREALATTVLAAVCGLGVSLALVPSLGVTGAAIGYAVGVATVNVANYHVLRSRVGMVVHADPPLLLRTLRQRIS